MFYCTDSRIHEGLEEAVVQIKGAAEFPEDTAYGVVGDDEPSSNSSL